MIGSAWCPRERERSRTARVLIMEVAALDEIGVVFAFAVWADVPSALFVGMVIASLADLSFAWSFFAKGAMGVMVHAIRKLFLLFKSCLECSLLAIRTGLARSLRSSGVGGGRLGP